MKGYFGRYLEVSLSNEETKDYPIPADWYRKYLGGRGIGARILLEELDTEVDPLGPDNIVIFGTGPLQGLNIPGGGRHVVMAKSPKTNSVSGSYVGGFFGQELGKSGYDGLIIRGSAETPKHLVLKDEDAKLKDARDLWGTETGSFEDKIQEREGDVRVASIGRAGENLINYSCIIHDKNRAAGRPGFGAVLGSKKLKGIAVKGEDKKDIADQEILEQLKGEFAKELAEANEGLGKFGSGEGVLGLNEMGILPTKNFQQGGFSEAEEITGQKMAETILTERDNCSACPIRCKRVVETEFNGEKIRPEYGGPEYETLAAFGSLCLNDNLDAIALANQKCNQYGLDTISAGDTIAFAMEASEKGLLDREIEWGDPQIIVDLVEKIALKEGIGKELAKGIATLKEELKADFAMEIKGQEVPMHEPRGKKGLGISYATTPRGATHMEGIHDELLMDEPLAPELGVTEPMDRFSLSEGKVKAAKIFEDLRSFTNSLIMCTYTTDMVGEHYAFKTVRKFLQSVTGNKLTPENMLKIGERNYLLLRLLATREGYTTTEDELPKRFKKPLPSGATEGERIPQGKLDEMLDSYYNLRGYNKDGSPSEEKRKELGINNLT